MMAGHPNETRPDGLRNLPFTLHMGGEDFRHEELECGLFDHALCVPVGLALSGA